MPWSARSTPPGPPHPVLDSVWPLLDRVPPLRRWHQRSQARRFAHNAGANLFLGVHGSFEAALAHVPPDQPVGYDHDAAADLYTPSVCPWDYPSLFWLGRCFAEGATRVFDLGGHIGIKYLAFRHLLPYPRGLRWTVCDVPAVVARGRELAAARHVEADLRFTTDTAELAGHDVVFASGSLQYLPWSLPAALSAMASPPRWVVVNITPVHADTGYVTLNSIGPAVCPYRVFAREALLQDFAAAGYRRRDEWQNLGKGLPLPGRPDLSLEAYTGLCFERAAA